MSTTSGRTPVDRRLRHAARSHARAVQTAERRIARLQQAIERDRAWLRTQHRIEETRFGRPVPDDPFILDVLANVDIEPGDVWRWRGGTNNHGAPTVRMRLPGSERTVVRVLAEAFGVASTDDHGTLYPLGDRLDVNPFHRVLRRAGQPLGNPARWRRRELDL